MCYIDEIGSIRIGNNVSITHNTSILSSNHTWDNKDIPIEYNPTVNHEVVIEDNVRIGCGCRILSGVTLYSRSILATGSVLTKDIEPNSLYAGVPTKI